MSEARNGANGAANGELLRVRDFKKHFKVGRESLKAVDGVSFEIGRGETLRLVGETSCGKSTVGRVLTRLYEPTGGEVIYGGENVHEARGAGARELNRKVQMIFQDHQASLNPRMVVGDIVAEGLDIHGLAKGEARRQRVSELLEVVGLNEDHATRYPHEFSGGQRQRIGVARALAVEPEFIVADEPVSALDVSIQAQIINLLRRLQRERSLTYLFIAHDLSVVKHISDRIGVMYLGALVKLAPGEELYANPRHPYTKALLSAVPVPDPDVESSRERIVLEGDVPSPVDPPSGCRFRNRCPHATPACAETEPPWREVSRGHWVQACPCFA